jgi:hypothetical protein
VYRRQQRQQSYGLASDSMQSGNLGGLREVSFGFSEDVGTLGFLYTPFDVFGFFVVVYQV